MSETTEPTCTCDERRWTVCHEIGTEPHLVGCPRWGWPDRPYGPTREWDTAGPADPVASLQDFLR